MTCESIPEPETTSSSFVELVKAQDTQAWSRLARLYGPLVYRWARQSGLQECDAADVTQEVFQVVAQKVQEFDRERGARFRAWLWGITRNKVREHFRTFETRPSAAGGSSAHHFWQQFEDFPQQEPKSDAPFNEDAALLHRALDLIRPDFTERAWEAFWRAVINAERTDAIANDLGMTTEAVRQAKYRILKRLRCELQENSDQPPSPDIA